MDQLIAKFRNLNISQKNDKELNKLCSEFNKLNIEERINIIQLLRNAVDMMMNKKCCYIGKPDSCKMVC